MSKLPSTARMYKAHAIALARAQAAIRFPAVGWQLQTLPLVDLRAANTAKELGVPQATLDTIVQAYETDVTGAPPQGVRVDRGEGRPINFKETK